jgi:hypothetical protein
LSIERRSSQRRWRVVTPLRVNSRLVLAVDQDRIFMVNFIVAACVDAQTRHPVADLNQRERRRSRQSLWAVTLVGAALSGGRGDDVALIEKLAEFQMTRGAIADYHVNVETHTLDIKINPTTPLPTGEASETGRKTCALGIEDLAAKLTHPWTVRVFINSQTAQVFVCEIAAAPARALLRPQTTVAMAYGSGIDGEALAGRPHRARPRW